MYPYWSIPTGDDGYDGNIYFNDNGKWIISISSQNDNYYKVYYTDSDTYFVPLDAVWMDTDTPSGISQLSYRFSLQCSVGIVTDPPSTAVSNIEKEAASDEDFHDSLWFWMTMALFLLFIAICCLFLCFFMKKRKQKPDLINFNVNLVPQGIQLEQSGVARQSSAVFSQSLPITPVTPAVDDIATSPKEEEGQQTTAAMSYGSEDNVFSV